MQVGFVEPSCNYNIVLTEADLKRLIEKGYIMYRPERIEGSRINDHGKSKNVSGHALMYNDTCENDKEYDEPVQFVGIGLKQNKNRE